MTAPSPSSSLSQAVDDHIAWLTLWNRLAFVDLGNRVAQAEQLLAPVSFAHWRHNAVQSLPEDQPAIEQVTLNYEQLHTMAKLVLQKTPDGKPIATADYEAVLARYNELMQGLRRMERAFAAVASGLDFLTGLRSRLGLKEDLAREHNRFLRTGKPFCVVVGDVDHFKKINDTYGHDAGDRVLAAVADHITRGIRGFDDAYRTGGEEFLLCLKEADLAVGLLVLERLRMKLEKLPILLPDGTSVNVTASFGIVVSSKDLSPQEMPQLADKALYRAKKEGRNKVVVAS
ncbi:MAG: diguanylate cyclase [Alphaproteobacteria bacterium]